MTAKEIADCIQGLTIGQGRHAGERFKLLGWQRRFLSGAFGQPGDAALSMACGGGKSTFTAAIVETFDLEVLHGAVKDALRLGAIGYDAVKHLVLCRIERRPPKLDLDIYPYLPRANVATTAAASYMSLLGGGAS